MRERQAWLFLIYSAIYSTLEAVPMLFFQTHYYVSASHQHTSPRACGFILQFSPIEFHLFHDEPAICLPLILLAAFPVCQQAEQLQQILPAATITATTRQAYSNLYSWLCSLNAHISWTLPLQDLQAVSRSLQGTKYSPWPLLICECFAPRGGEDVMCYLHHRRASLFVRLN